MFKLKMNPDGLHEITFTTDPHINMSIEELKAVDSASQTDSIFVSNIVIHFYGTERLKGMSVTGQPTPRFKNVRRKDGSLLYLPRGQIEPNVFKFIYEKLVERVAQRLGPSKVKEIAYFANEHIAKKNRQSEQSSSSSPRIDELPVSEA